MFTPSATPSLSFPLSTNAVEKSADSSAAPSETAQLTRRLAAGDDAAFREFHAKYFDGLYRFLLVVTHGQEQEAQEALQQTLLRVVRYVRGFESEEVFWGWLKAVARSAARDGNRKRQRYCALLHRFAMEPPDLSRKMEEETRLLCLLDESMAELAPQDRQLLEAKYLEGFTVRELCAHTGLTEKGTESRLDRLRRILRKRILKRLSLE